ncbi:hypothetical protein QR680_015081 [Steinernema hermaphroditum]|uniref:Uncharacterized protein n=1 Tax=Steinernema hermaphroditum TaxID=289476 RepID=A0AA39M5C5_9BILA|nr:hypothetical protein QR680_015081 [Steinernema hermaphroditum]
MAAPQKLDEWKYNFAKLFIIAAIVLVTFSCIYITYTVGWSLFFIAWSVTNVLIPLLSLRAICRKPSSFSTMIFKVFCHQMIICSFFNYCFFTFSIDPQLEGADSAVDYLAGVFTAGDVLYMIVVHFLVKTPVRAKNRTQ